MALELREACLHSARKPVRIRMMYQPVLRVGGAMALVLVVGAACVPSPTNVPSVRAMPTASPAATSTPRPTNTPPPTAVTQAFFCVWDATPTPSLPACRLPEAEERDRFCVKKVPYTLIALPEGDTYRVLMPGIVCTDAGLKRGVQLVTCTGPQSYSFLLEICNPSCAALPTPTRDTTVPSEICPPGFNYLSDRACCQAAGGASLGCVTLKFATRACGAANCSKIASRAACNATPGCAWGVDVASGKSACRPK